jgi:hypothetical protein
MLYETGIGSVGVEAMIQDCRPLVHTIYARAYYMETL